jgi:thymidylate synthase
MMTSYNPAQMSESVLAPCHSLVVQFYTENDADNTLSIKMYQRSADMFLGVPFNIASTALLLYIVCKVTNKKPGKMFISFGDTHIYEGHLDAVKKQLQRELHPLPQLLIDKEFKYNNNSDDNNSSVDQMIEYIENLSYDDFQLDNYRSGKPIKAEMYA